MRKEDFLSTKMEVCGSTESIKVQNALFKLGCYWGVGSKSPKYVNVPFLYVDKRGCLTYSDSNERTYFRNIDSREVTPRDLLLPDWERRLQE